MTWHASESAKRVDLDTLTAEQVQNWKPGERLLLNGKLLTGRDAAHKRIQELLDSGQGLPPGVDFTNRLIYYVGPVDPVRDEAVGPAGPTTATRMDKFTEMMLSKTGLIGMVGKAERGPVAIESIKAQGRLPDGRRRRRLPGVPGDPLGQGHRVRGAGHGGDLRIRSRGYAGDSGRRQQGESVHQTGPAEWRVKIENLNLTITPSPAPHFRGEYQPSSVPSPGSWPSAPRADGGKTPPLSPGERLGGQRARPSGNRCQPYGASKQRDKLPSRGNRL